MGILFGTDGVRGIANLELTPEMVFDLGRAGSYVLAKQYKAARPRIMVGKDTRISGDMLEAALVAGILSTGADVLTLGVIPTPAVAYLTQKYKASCGIVISASHNPVQDNGIKFFGSSGYKLPDEIEDEIMKIIAELRNCETVICLGSDERLKLAEGILDGQIIPYELGTSPITEDKWVDPKEIRKILRSIKASRPGRN